MQKKRNLNSILLKKNDAKKRNLNSILLKKMEDGERGNFVTVRFEGKFRKGGSVEGGGGF
jgi:hypothetical protein